MALTGIREIQDGLKLIQEVLACRQPSQLATGFQMAQSIYKQAYG
jgi:hypothetical protein